MIKYLPTPLLILTLFSSAVAQTAVPPAPTAPIVVSPELSAGRGDTLAAIANLFERRRTGAKRWVYVGVGGAATLVRVLTASRSTSTPYGVSSTESVDGGAVALVGGLLVGVPAALWIGNMTAFSEKREKEVDRAYRAGQPLPKGVRQQLKKKDFQ